MNKYYTFSFIIIVLAAIAGAWLYPQMPSIMPSHWNIAGEIDGYMPKALALFLMPGLALLMLLLLMWFPKADPKQENVKYNQKYYEKVVLAIIIFLFYIYILSLTAALGYRPNMGILIVPALGLLFYFMGRQMEHIKSNWFFGIRTPWTIHSEAVWEKTHKIGSKIFQAFGILFFCLGFLSQAFAFYLLMFFCGLILIWSFVYPYWEWKKTK